MRTVRLATLLLTVAFTSLAPWPAQAQGAGAIVGQVVDTSTGKPVPDADVTFVRAGTDQRITVRTDRQGRYAHLGLHPGRYDVAVEREGFAAVDVVAVDLRLADRLRINVRMTDLSEAPFKRETIPYERPMLDLESSTITK